MTNGTQVQAGDTVGGVQPPAALPPLDPPVVKPPRPPLTVIPRRATGTHTAIPDMDDTPPDAARTEEFGPPVPAAPPATPAGRSRRHLVLTAAAGSLVAVLGLAGLVWLGTDRPTAAPQRVLPIGAEVPPVAPPEPSATVTEPDAPGAPPADVVRPDDWMPDGGLPDSEPTTGLPGAPADTAPTTGPTPTATTAPPAADRPTLEPPRRQPPRQKVPADPIAPPQGRANIAGRNLALNRPIFASSSTNRLRSPGQAVDGSLLSRWSTRFTNPQWIAVDLGDTWHINRVRIAWELAYADTYRVDLSTDGRSWRSVWQTRAGLGGTVGIPLGDATARYVRVYGVKPAGRFGFSIRELHVR